MSREVVGAKDSVAVGDCKQDDGCIYLVFNNESRRFWLLSLNCHGDTNFVWKTMSGPSLVSGNCYPGNGDMNFQNALNFGLSMDNWSIYQCEDIQDMARTILKLSGTE